MTDQAKEPEINPDEETKYLAGTPQFKKMKSMAIEAAKHRLRESLRTPLEGISKERERKDRKRGNPAGAAAALEGVMSILDMSIEEQALMQFACMTQSSFDCMTRATAPEDDDDEDEPDRWSRRRPAPAATRHSERHAELAGQARLAGASAQMLDALTRSRTNGQHLFTFRHEREPTPMVPAPEPQPEPQAPEQEKDYGEAWVAHTAELGVNMCFYGMEDAFDAAYTPSPQKV